MRRTILRMLTISSALSPVFAAHAEEQVGEQPPGVATSQNTGLDIVVTATRREARLQDVPISIQAISADQLLKSS